MSRMYVVKRNGTKEEVSFDKIHNRIKYLVKEPYNLPNVNASHIAQFVINGLYDGIPTTEIDTYSAKVSASLSIKNYDYNVLAGRIVVNNHHKNTLTSFKDKVDNLYLWTSKDGDKKSIVSNMFYKFVKKNQKKIEEYIDYNRDYLIDFYGFKTLEQSYLLKMDDQIIERPQDLFMRVSIGLHMNTKNTTSEVLKDIFNTYDLISQKYCTHATPTLFNCGLKNPALLSCFLLGSEDSLEGIMKTALDCARISKWSGGIGFHMSNWRGEGGYIRGTGGKSSGVVPFLKIFNDVARAVNQGGRRLGRFAVYIEPHHSDIMGFLSLRKNHGDENLRTRDLFMGMWISDLFMHRVEKNLKWSVFDADKCPGLNEVFGDEYTKLYEEYESKGLAEHTYNAREIWHAIFMSQKESGIPYLCYKDTVNRNSNQKNIGVIKSSNLCVSGDTLILTDKGYHPIKELTEQAPTHNVWNGDEFTQATFAKTGEDQELLEIELTHGQTIKCTPYHKFLLHSDDKECIVEAKDLKVDDKLIKYDMPTGYELEEHTTFNQIKSITKLEQKEDTYCFNEPKRHRGIFGGVLLGNCTEILEVSSSTEYACCSLASVCLSALTEDSYTPEELDLSETARRTLNHDFPENAVFNYEKMTHIVETLVRNLNKVIDYNHYPVIEAKVSNYRHRPIGIGVQGLSDVYFKFDTSFDSDLSRTLNKRIFETLYFAAVSASNKICQEEYEQYYKECQEKGKVVIPQYVFNGSKITTKKTTYEKPEDIPTTITAYSTFEHNGGSPLSKGVFSTLR